MVRRVVAPDLLLQLPGELEVLARARRVLVGDLDQHPGARVEDAMQGEEGRFSTLYRVQRTRFDTIHSLTLYT